MDAITRRENPFLCRYIDKEVQSMFFPLNLMQSLSLNPKYQIRRNFVNPNSVSNNLVSFCGLLTCLILSLCRICAGLFDENMQRYQIINFLYFATIFDALFYVFGYVMNFIHNVLHTNDNVHFLLTFQKIHRFIYNFPSTKRVVRRHWLIVIMLLLFHITTCTYVYVVYLHPPWYVICYIFILSTLDCNDVYAICLMKLLREKVEQWNENILKSLSIDNRVMCCNKMSHAYTHILQCYNVYKKVFQLPVSRCEK